MRVNGLKSKNGIAKFWQGLALETHTSLPLLALPLLVAIWLATSHFIRIERASAQRAAIVSTRELIDTYEAQLAHNLSAIDQTLKVIKYSVELNGTKDALRALNQRDLLPASLVFETRIANRDGTIVASNPMRPSSSIALSSDFLYFKKNPAADQFVSQVALDANSHDMRLHFTRRLSDADGNFAGLAMIAIEPAYFTSGYEPSRLGERGVLGLFGNDGVFRAIRSGERVTWGQHAAETQTLEPGLVRSPWDGVQRFTSVRPMHGFPLIALAGLDEHEQMAAFEQHRRGYLWQATLASLTLAFIVGLLCTWSWQLNKTRRRIRAAQQTYAAASEASMDAFFVLQGVCNELGVITDFELADLNRQAEKITGMPKRDLLGKRLCQLLPECRENGILQQLIEVTASGGVHECEWENHMPQISAKWMHRQVVGVEGGIVAIVRDISERKQAEAKILHLAQHDTLTGLPNRNLIGDRLNQAILQAKRNKSMVAVAFIDLDGFKLINDGLGHSAGDELLKIVGTRMVKCVRREDTVGRFGGDEFIILLSGQYVDSSVITPLLEKLNDAVTQPIILGGQELRISCSIGIALYPQDGADSNSLFTNADAAMYRAKEMGHNHYQFYTRTMNVDVEKKLALLEGLRGALAADQFTLLYQPKVDLRTNRIFGVEALLRWQHPELGMVSPLQFIPLAEQSGLIIAIGEWVLRQACLQSVAWQAAGLAPITMSVNVSPRQFEENRLLERIQRSLNDSGLDSSKLELEVTESLIMRDLQQSLEKMRAIEAMGIALSIDDFGTGYSSLSVLKSFPISRLKIDKSFISELAHDLDDQAITLAVISLAHKLKLRVIAEGVETEQQREFLRANDCDEMQGYLFSRPVSADQIQAMLEQQQEISKDNAS